MASLRALLGSEVDRYVLRLKAFLDALVATLAGWRVEAPRHPDRQLWRYGLEEKPRGSRALPRWWVVERTFARRGRAGRPSKDYERLPETGVTVIHTATSRVMLRRLARAAC